MIQNTELIAETCRLKAEKSWIIPDVPYERTKYRSTIITFGVKKEKLNLKISMTDISMAFTEFELE